MSKKEKQIKIGIPKALFYYHHFPFWKSFFENLGLEVIISPSTDKEILTQGISRLTSEVCLPVKAFAGHVLSLKKKCDFIFIPAIYNLGGFENFEKKLQGCPKFIGLPDLIKAVTPEIPPILEPDLNFNKGKGKFYFTLYKIGNSFTQNPFKIKRAIKEALRSQKEFENEFRKGRKRKDKEATVGLIGHPYLLYDEYLNHRIVSHLEKMEVEVLFPEMVPKEKLENSILKVLDCPYWTSEKELIGAGVYFAEKKEIDGLILISAFGCGPDSVMTELLENYAKKFRKPFLQIVLDEHTAETGLITRLEAFVETIFQQKRCFFKKEIFLRKSFEEKEKKISKLGLPYLGGRTKIFSKILEKNFGISVISPAVTEKTIELGVKYSPETICFPFKVILGTYLECLEKGADTLLMVSNLSGCRNRYYDRLLENIFTQLGYDFRFLKADAQDKGIKGVLKTIKKFSNNAPWPKIFSVVRIGITKLRVLDGIEREVQKIRAREFKKGEADQILKEAIEAINEAENLLELKEISKKYLEKLENIPKKKEERFLKVGLIGEIFVLIEPFVNLEIEKELGKMDVGTERVKSTYLSEYTKIFQTDPLSSEKRELKPFTQKYLRRDVGGHALESLGRKITWANQFDGLIHVMPFGCLPEVIAQNIMISTKEKIPVLTVPCDDQLGKAGLITRLEAFVDLIRNYHHQRTI